MTSSRTDQKALADALWSARTPEDVLRIEELACQVYGEVDTRHVGNRENNIGTIRVGSDPALGVVERITNAMDAMLELGHMKNPNDTPATPVEAAQLWYDVPLSGLGDMTDTERRTLGERLKVWLDESGIDKRPTVGVQDAGIGQTKKLMPHTILSLNESNKVRQPWTMGTYGQGGAVTYGFSKATIVISRRHPDFRGDEPDRVVWTIVREYDTDPEMDVLPTYKYLVGADNEVFELDPSLFPDLDHGTRFIHIEYDLQGWTGPYTTALWQLLNAALFDPVLPFLVTGYRSKEKNYGSRIVTGNAARLARPDRARGDIEIAHTDAAQVDLGEYGSVRLEYWVLQRPEGSASSSDPASGYVRPDSAVSITLFGQRQDTESRQWIRSNAELPFLYKNIIVQISANGLTAKGKRELFAATRERATKSDLRTEIYQKLANVLRNDEELRRLNNVEKERLVQRSTAASSEKVRKRLAKFIKTRLKDRTRFGKGGSEAGDGGRVRRPPTRTGISKRDTDDSNLLSVPTHLRFERDRLRIYQGGSAYTWVDINAKNGYLPEHDDDLSFEWASEGVEAKVRVVMRSKLLGGRSRWFFEADPDAPLGEYELQATLITANGVLTDSIIVDVRVPQEAKPRSRGTEPDTGPRVMWVTRDYWEEHNMTERSVGYVTVDEETIIFVNRHYHLLERALGSRHLTPEQIETRAERYQFPVACALWLQHEAVRRAGGKAPSDEYRQEELERLAEAVILASDPDVVAAFEEGGG